MRLVPVLGLIVCAALEARTQAPTSVSAGQATSVTSGGGGSGALPTRINSGTVGERRGPVIAPGTGG